MKTKNLRKNVMLLAPLFGLVALLVAFFIIGTSKNINVAYGMKSIINQSVVVAVVATGAIFIYTLGSFDISLGASVAVSALVGGIVYNKTESLVIMFAACLGVAVFIGLFNSVLASIFTGGKNMKKILAMLLATVMVVGCFTGCGSDKKNDSSEVVSTEQSGSKEETPELDMSETVKMGILVSDATSAEALAFRTYYTEYIQKQYNVELIYSDELKDAAGETSAIDTFITNNCKAIISFSSFDRAAQIEQCEAAGVYYAVATGTLTDEEYETYKGYEHYVGAIGPSLEVEYQTGYDMANYYLEQGKKNFAIFGGAIPYYTDMHIYRAAGMIAAMVDAGGADANYKGATDEAGIIGQIYADGQIETGAIGDVNIVGYVGGYDMDDAWFGKCAQMAQTPDLEVILAVGNGSDFFGTAIEGTDVKIASVDAYAESYGTAMDGGMLDYLAGKFSASIGPIFIATYRAVLGSPIRTEDGNALALSQGYWVATSPEEFSEYYAVDSSVDSPAYTKGMLDGLLTADYASFEKFVSAYGFKDIQKEAK